jgi:hypothetical protein
VVKIVPIDKYLYHNVLLGDCFKIILFIETWFAMVSNLTHCLGHSSKDVNALQKKKQMYMKTYRDTDRVTDRDTDMDRDRDTNMDRDGETDRDRDIKTDKDLGRNTDEDKDRDSDRDTETVNELLTISAISHTKSTSHCKKIYIVKEITATTKIHNPEFFVVIVTPLQHFSG